MPCHPDRVRAHYASGESLPRAAYMGRDVKIVPIGKLEGTSSDHMLICSQDQLVDIMRCVKLACAFMEYDKHPGILKDPVFAGCKHTMDRMGLHGYLKEAFEKLGLDQ